jgi:hypothetical protein
MYVHDTHCELALQCLKSNTDATTRMRLHTITALLLPLLLPDVLMK